MSAAASSSLVAKTFPSSSRCRLRADPAIATSDLMEAFKELFVKEDSRILKGYSQDLESSARHGLEVHTTVQMASASQPFFHEASALF